MDVFGELDAECLIESGDVAHDVGLREDVIVAKEGFVGRTVERDDVAEHAPVFGLQFAPVASSRIRTRSAFDLVELLAHQSQLLLRPIAADPVECRFQRIERGTAVFHEFAALQMVEEFVVFRIEQAPGTRRYSLLRLSARSTAGESLIGDSK